MSFTEKLDNLMEEKNINKAELSRASGIPYTTIDGFYKKGSDNVKLSTLKRLCSFFNCSLDYLVDDSVSSEVICGNTVTAQFDSTEYTAEELDRIKEFATFLKSSRKDDEKGERLA
jgi:DNA-binding Xre family transcriptional regulator